MVTPRHETDALRGLGSARRLLENCTRIAADFAAEKHGGYSGEQRKPREILRLEPVGAVVLLGRRGLHDLQGFCGGSRVPMVKSAGVKL